MAIDTTLPPHPRADQIRQQVEFYLSDENLSNPDEYLLMRLGANGENHPIAFSVFKGFHKMHKLMKPKLKDPQMAAALQTSTVLRVVGDNMVQRVRPFVYDDGDESGDGRWQEKARKPQLKSIPDHPALALGKLKKAKDATGFEVTFADAPITPKEYEEEQELYSELNDIPSRIEHALTRYVNRRKFRGHYQRMFDEFLKFGGVHKASRQGQGEGKRKYLKGIHERADMSLEDIEEQDAEYDVNWADKLDDGKWVLDFSGLAQAYLSTVFPEIWDAYTDEQVDIQCGLLANFYNYLLHHEVVPEYKSDILLSQAICEEARTQLKTIKQLERMLPTPLTKACSILFGGEWQTVYSYDPTWEDDTPGATVRMRNEDARLIVTTAIMALGSDEMFSAATGDATDLDQDYKTCLNLQFSEMRIVTMEVVSIERATDETKELYQASGVAKKQMQMEPKPVGTLTCKYWSPGNEEEYDLPSHLLPLANHKDEEYTFWLEDDLLALMFPGMKISAGIRRLSVVGSQQQGVWVLDDVARLWCSFYKCILNELCTQRHKVVTVFTDKQQSEMTVEEKEAEEKGNGNESGSAGGGLSDGD